MRITGMKNLVQILQYLRKDIGINQINKKTKSHKTVIKKVNNIAIDNNWKNPNSPIPSEEELQKAYISTFKSEEKKHFLDNYKDKIKLWKNEEKESFVVISQKLSKLMTNRKIAQSTLRDYYNRKIGKPIKLNHRRENKEPHRSAVC